MKKFLIIAFLSICACTNMIGQTVTSGDYKITVSDLQSKKYSSDESKYIEYNGNYVIYKKGKEIARQKFSTLQIDKSIFTLNVKMDEDFGNSLAFDFETKRYEFMGEEHEITKYKTSEDLILSGFVVYLKIFDEE